MSLRDLQFGIALMSLGAVSPGCAKSVEVIGFGPLESEPPAATPPPVTVDTPVSPIDEPDVGVQASAPDASTPPPADVGAPASAPDASTPPPLMDAGAPVDAAAAPTPDAAPTLGPFGTPELLEGFEGADDPSFTADDLEIYFDANDQSYIHVATRPAPEEPWGEPVPLDAVGEGATGKTPWITPDGLQLYFAAARTDGPGGNDLWWIARPDRTSPWEAARLIPNVNTGMEEYAPSLSSDGLQLLFTRSNSAPSTEELWLTRRDSVSAEWQEPESLSINDPRAKDSDPVFSPDGLEVWWVRGVSNTDHDLYFATRATAEEAFAMPTPADVLNSTAWEGDPWLSADGREIVFFSNRTGERLLYRATR